MQARAIRSIFSLLLVVAFPVMPAQAQDAGALPTDLRARAKQYAGLDYRAFHRVQQRLQTLLPPEPRLVDVWLQDARPERDAWQPEGWNVAVLGRTLEQAVPVRRGGYFLLPGLAPEEEEGARIVFREPGRRRTLAIQWQLRVGADGRIGQRTLVEALGQLRTVQESIPFYAAALWREKNARYDGIKACFLAPGGAILVDGQPAPGPTVGDCRIMKIAPGEGTVAFTGELDIVTFVQTANNP